MVAAAEPYRAGGATPCGNRVRGACGVCPDAEEHTESVPEVRHSCSRAFRKRIFEDFTLEAYFFV